MTDTYDTPEHAQGSESAAAQDILGMTRRALEDSGAEFGIGDDGELAMFFPESDTDASDEDAGADLTDAEGGQEGGGSQWEQRYKDVQSWATKVSQENADLRERLARIEGRLEGSQAGNTEDRVEDEEIPEFETNADLIRYLKERDERIRAEMREELEPLKIRQSIQSELDEARSDPEMPDFDLYAPAVQMLITSNPGKDIPFKTAYKAAKKAMPDLPDWMPGIQEVVQLYPKANLTIFQAYDLAREMFELVEDDGSGADGSERTAPAPAQNPRPGSNRQDLMDRARRLSFVTGVDSGETLPTEAAKPVEGTRDAMELAWAELQANG